MGGTEFKKNKFIFSKKKDYNKDIKEKELTREVKLLTKMCEAYGLKFSVLARKNPTSDRLDMLANAAKFIVEDEKLIAVFKKSKKLPILLIGERTHIKLEVLKTWQNYLSFYVIIFMDGKYPEINNYLNIQLNNNEQSNKIRIVENETIYTGIALKLSLKSTIILTSKGLLVRAEYVDNMALGKIVKSKKTREFKNLIYKVAGVIFIMSVIGLCFTLYYNREYTNVVVKTTSEIRITLNEFNKVIDISSPTQKGKELIKSESLKHKSLDDTMTGILEYADDNAMIPEDGRINVIVTGQRLDLSTLENTIKNVSNQKADTNKKEREYRLLINNAGIEENIMDQSENAKK